MSIDSQKEDQKSDQTSSNSRKTAGQRKTLKTKTLSGTRTSARTCLSKDIETLMPAKVDRQIKHIIASERKRGKSLKEARRIAYATVNKQGRLTPRSKIMRK